MVLNYVCQSNTFSCFEWESNISNCGNLQQLLKLEKVNQLLIFLENSFLLVDLYDIVNSKLVMTVPLQKLIFCLLWATLQGWHREMCILNTFCKGLCEFCQPQAVSHFKTVFAYSINNLNVLFIFNIAICHC